MKKFEVTEIYLQKVWYKKTFICEAESDDQVYDSEYENEVLLSQEEVESEFGGWSEIDSCQEIEDNLTKKT